MDFIVVHYAEIALKGSNRGWFENLLVKNIRLKLGSLIESCSREYGQIVIQIKPGADIAKIRDVLSRIPGVAYFSIACRCSLDIDTIRKEVLSFLRDKEFKTFKVNARRHNKNTRLTSRELNNILGSAIEEEYHWKVKMNQPDLTIKVEISDKHAYISCGDIAGTGGLPTNPAQKVVALISGGFDSPVAAYLMMKRGCTVTLAHFQNKNQATEAVENKILELAKQLARYQTKTRLYITPFENVQKEIIIKVKPDLRQLIYRRFMIRIASKIADKLKAKFLVVGDSLSQVASQTYENIAATYPGSEKHILSPLIGLDKEEIIRIAKRIGTYEISAQPYPDCCSYLISKHPELRASPEMLEKAESAFDITALVRDAVKRARVISPGIRNHAPDTTA
ncbi:tRNA 4-thiouridine(8) synthase ThiI [Candidatus Woesearchaeota archaeon CG08_land_8_20_14_0_20_47_9]|nr:MAG: tRNA 4-thiouridine(8) synthase ThiI [Candidatus Woesearchaeota archaeon CG1_02_47_18]PIN72802.1 MAG: tRNA 4-thiouridine(8) synthase ThiI [Candidatus Woesearchaeota archaeon CG10_big_fil_rev_8_21_14_0_10_47_5]PIO03106.1 MAG: tRNA 4-thiouridine(8) synthase ThiI [Candidatus Woesearchaeota archaeon CG08_land_8_20_14_0_20_47_9]HII30318.1 tRNA 4-thiouridine(8) synthase ThiI [Candidatus Woesearchaeota archaeon]